MAFEDALASQEVEFIKELVEFTKEFIKEQVEFTKEFIKEQVEFAKEFVKASRQIYKLIFMNPIVNTIQMADSSLCRIMKLTQQGRKW